MQSIRGVLLWVGCFIVAVPVAQFYNDSRLLWLLPIVGSTVLFDGFNSTAIATLNRKVALGKLTLFEFGVQFASLAVMIGWSFFSPTLWALVAGNFFSGILRLVWSYWLEPGSSNRFAWDKESVRELARFGRWIFISTAMTFLAQQSDRLILGKLFSLEMLGVYTVAFTFAFIPNSLIMSINSKVIFPVVSQKADLPRHELRARILPKRWVLLVAIGGGIALLSCFGDLIVLNLYDQRYREAGWMLAILALGNWPSAMGLTVNSSLLAIGKPLYGAFGQFFKFLYMVIAIPVAFAYLGTFGAILAIALNDFPYYIAALYGAWREKLLMVTQDFWATLLLIGAMAVICVSRYVLGLGLPIDGISIGY
jgi:O-antigen/teichoic acid export membrane protein